MHIVQRPIPPDITLSHTTPMPALLERIYLARGITDVSQLDKHLQALLSFESLKDIDRACKRLARALNNQEQMTIIGDFDADGATSTALAVLALKAMGAKYVNYLVPNRFAYGYGLTPAIVDAAHEVQRPSLIITVDNGIVSFDGVDRAKEHGIDVIITDHHLSLETLPNACAIVNPNQHADTFASKAIAGVGVIFYVMVALRRYLIERQWFTQQPITEPNMAQFLDLVALGTVADVVALDKNNRILVDKGLRRIRQGLCRPGIQALIEIANRQPAKLRESDLGFAIAPRLNAAGRLDDMSLGIECLLTDDFTKAKQLAIRLDELNHDRKLIEQEMKEQALLALKQLTQTMQETCLPLALCLTDKSWHQGVIGILAGRLKDKFHRPVVIFASIDSQEMKGSARSITGLNIRDVLAEIDKNHPNLMIKFGGHAMAAGLSIKPCHFDAFKQAFIEEISHHVDETLGQSQILTDGTLAAKDLTLATATLIEQAGPWGQLFPLPCFEGIFELLDQRLVGQHHLKLTLGVPDSELVLDAIAFNIDTNLWPNHRLKQVFLAYKLDINEYQGRTRLQLIIEALKPVN